MHYCPGCTHGIIHRLIAEVIDELDIEGITVGFRLLDVHIIMNILIVTWCRQHTAGLLR